jgi:hypothetical protein
MAAKQKKNVTKKKYAFELREHPIEYQELALKSLHVEPQAQRTFKEPHARRIADNFIPGAVGALVVSHRESGIINTCDGVHRKWAMEVQVPPIEKVMCEVHYGLSLVEEAMLFLIKNKESASVQPIDMYKVGLTAEIPLYVDTELVLMNHNLSVGNTSANQIGAVSGLVKIVEDNEEKGTEVLDRVLTIAEGAWGRTEATWDGAILAGLGLFVSRHGEEVKDTGFIAKLAKGGTAGQYKGKVVTAAGIGYGGSGGRTQAAYNVFKNRYNSGRGEATRLV